MTLEILETSTNQCHSILQHALYFEAFYVSDLVSSIPNVLASSVVTLLLHSLTPLLGSFIRYQESHLLAISIHFQNKHELHLWVLSLDLKELIRTNQACCRLLNPNPPLTLNFNYSLIYLPNALNLT